MSKDRHLKRRRLRRLLVVGAIVSLLAFAYVQLFLARPMGRGPAGPAVSAASFKSEWTSRPIHILGIGDSITTGFGANSKSHSYFERLIENPADEFEDMQGKCLTSVLPNITKDNVAVSGSTSLQHEGYIEDRVPEHSSEVFGMVMLTTGGNDIIHNYGRSPPREGAMYGATLKQAKQWITNFDARLNRMLDEIQSRFPGGCEIYLADIYDPTDGVGDAPSVFLPKWPGGLAIHAEYNKIIHDTAERRAGVFLVSLHRHFLGHGSHCRQFWRETFDWSDPNCWFFTNIEDPNDRGYDAIRRVFLNTICEQSSLVGSQ